MPNKFLSLSLSLLLGSAQAGDILVIGHENVPPIDPPVIERIFTGRVISVAGVAITPVTLKPGTAERDQFLRRFLDQDEEQYTGYWTVRRYIGKGAPPAEFAGAAELIRYIQATPGAVGYIQDRELPAGIQVLARR
jgi:hypothetical protein